MKLRDPWLVATWPGMGGVGLIAGTYLMEKLRATRVAEVPLADFFDARQVKISGGLLQPASASHGALYAWSDPSGARDLLIYLADAQPDSGAWRMSEAILAAAEAWGVARIVTFAAMATPCHPEAEPRVFAIATNPAFLDELRPLEIEVLSEGEISGLNGVFLAAGAAQGIPGACLLGEFPYFATTVPNPKPAAAVLRRFCSLSGASVDMGDLDEQATVVQGRLVELLERLQSSSDPPVVSSLPSGDGEGDEEPADADDMSGIEALFAAAAEDRAKAAELKAELDRRGLFRRYEDRFLDLFKRSE